MQYSVVKSSKIDLRDRIDAEYFEPSYIENESKLKKVNAEPLYKFVKLTSSAFYPSATGYYEIGEIPFIRCVDCIDFPAITELQNETFERLPYNFIKENKTIKKIKDEDIVITKVGTPCFASIIYGLGEVALSRTVLGVYRIKNIDPFYLIVFLRSKYGFDQLNRERELTIQYQLTLERVGRILTYKPTDDFQKKIRQLFIKSQNLYITEVELYKKAEKLLLTELGFLKWKPKYNLTFVKNFSETQKANRFDAEYFQPKYYEIIEVVKKYKGGAEKLANLVKIRDKNFTPKDNEQYKYIELSNISSNGEINGYVQNFGIDLPSRARRKVQKGDVIISTIEGSLESIALITENWTNALCSTGFFVINSDKINSETLLVLLKTKIGQMQLKKSCSGTILTAIGKDAFSKIVLPKVDPEIQDQIKEKIIEMYSTKKLSKSLLKIAKSGVELAIEKDEEEAGKWINNELEKLNVKIAESNFINA